MGKDLTDKAGSEGPGPSQFRDPVVRDTIKKAAVWLSMAAALFIAWQLVQPILLIFAGLVFAALLDGGTRLLGRVLPIGRGWRLAIVCISALLLLAAAFYWTGVEFIQQAGQLRATVTQQAQRVISWLETNGVMPSDAQWSDLRSQALGSLGKVTAAVGTVLGGITSLILVIVIGIFVAAEPKLYERGLAWMLPPQSRADFHVTADRMGYVMRRLLMGRMVGMAVEGIGTWIGLSLGGVPMAALLGLLTGLLTFIPNVGAFISGVLTILVGFSAGWDTGIWAICVYLIIQTVDGNIIVPMVAKRSVDLAPALVLAAQLLFGALFGIMGLILADPITAMVKVALERRSERNAETARLDGKVAG